MEPRLCQFLTRGLDKKMDTLILQEVRGDSGFVFGIF